MRCYFEISRGKNKGKRTGRREKKEGEDGAGNGKEWEKGKQREDLVIGKDKQKEKIERKKRTRLRTKNNRTKNNGK